MSENTETESIQENSSQLIEKFFHNQERELEVRLKEADVRVHEINSNKDIALKTVDHQASFLHEQLNKSLEMEKNRLIFWIFLVVLIIVFVSVMAFSGKEQIALMVITHIVAMLGGAGLVKVSEKPSDNKQ